MPRKKVSKKCVQQNRGRQGDKSEQYQQPAGCNLEPCCNHHTNCRQNGQSSGVREPKPLETAAVEGRQSRSSDDWQSLAKSRCMESRSCYREHGREDQTESWSAHARHLILTVFLSFETLLHTFYSFR